MQTKALPGFRDFYPEDLALRSYIFETWRKVATRYGFEEYDGPPLEPLELYTAKSGDEIVGQLYAFRDKGDRGVALRPEMTPTLARMVAARANGLKKPIRWFSIPQLFRYERQQRGRLREHFQLNCDLIGEAGPAADAEIIALAVDVLRAFGLGPDAVKVRISDRRLFHTILRQQGLTEAQVGAMYEVYDKLGRVPRDVSVTRMQEAGISAGSMERLLAFGDLPAPKRFEELLATQSEDVQKAYRPVKAVFDELAAIGLADFAVLDLTVVRGLAYYTGTVFEVFDAGKEYRAICGGGRYDTLLRELGGVDLPALGFGMGDVVLAEVLKEKGLVPGQRSSIDVFIAGIEGSDVPHVLQLAHDLRDAGVRTEYALNPQPIAKQLRLADTRNARVAIVVGPDDRARGEVVLKDLRQKVQRGVSRANVLNEVRALLDGNTA